MATVTTTSRPVKAQVSREFGVIDADTGDLVQEGFSMFILAQRWAADRSYGDRSLVVTPL